MISESRDQDKKPRRSRTWVRPAGGCTGFFALVVAIWYSGASQQNGAAYLLCFTLVGVAFVSILHTWNNVNALEIRCGPMEPVFVGDDMHISLSLRSRGKRGVEGLLIGKPKSPDEVELIPPGKAIRCDIVKKARLRGRFETLTIKSWSIWPLGLFRAFRKDRIQARHYIYPRPEGDLPLPTGLGQGSTTGVRQRAEGDDFAGVRDYRQGESQRHVDWKAFARGHPMVIKRFLGDVDETVWLAWESLQGVPPEMRLKQLARWIVVAERGSVAYGLKLPTGEIPVSRGESHFHRCMRALAEMPETIA